MSQRRKHVPPEFVHGAQSRRASNAAGPHQDRRNRRQNHRASATARAVNRNRKENQ